MSLPIRLFSGQVSDFDLKLVRTFRAVAECGGFSLAEMELGTTKSSISKQISDLEHRLGVTLCHRGRSGFALTDEGQFVYDASSKMLASLEGFRADLNTLKQKPTGTLHIGLIDSIITCDRSPLIEILSSFTERFPDIEVRMVTASAAEIDQSVADKRIQFGVSTKRGRVKGTETQALFSEVGFLYCARNHPLFNLDDSEISLELLERQRYVQHGYSESEIRGESKVDLVTSAVGQFTESVAMLVLTGNFVGFLPRHYAKPWIETGEMRAVLPDRIQKSTDIQLLYHTDLSNTPLISAFRGIVKAALVSEDV